MAGVTAAQAATKLSEALDAYSKILSSQEYSIANRTNKRAMLKDVEESIKYWDKKCKQLSRSSTGGGIRVRGGTIAYE